MRVKLAMCTHGYKTLLPTYERIPDIESTQMVEPYEIAGFTYKDRDSNGNEYYSWLSIHDIVKRIRSKNPQSIIGELHSAFFYAEYKLVCVDNVISLAFIDDDACYEKYIDRYATIAIDGYIINNGITRLLNLARRK